MFGIARDEDPDHFERPTERFEIMRPAEVVRLLNVSRTWLYAAARDGLIPAIRLGPDGPVRFIRTDVENFIETARANWRLGDNPRETLRRAAEETPQVTRPCDEDDEL